MLEFHSLCGPRCHTPPPIPGSVGTAQELLPTRSPATLKQFAGLWRALPGAGHEAALAAAVHALAADPQRLPHIPALLRRLCRACLPAHWLC